MKLKLRPTSAAIFSLLLSTPLSHAFAYESDETDEFFDRISPEVSAEILNQRRDSKSENQSELQKQASAIFQNKGKWTFKFLLVKKNGEEVLLSAQDAKNVMIPASIEKLLPGYIGYKKFPEYINKKKKVATVPYLTHMLRESDCVQADSVFSASGGAAAARKYMTTDMKLTIPTEVKILDGSGNDVKNRMSPEFMTSYLKNIHASTDYSAFTDMLAQPGKNGTLENRLPSLAGSLFAKTGSMKNTRVASLAGYVETTLGTLIFTVMGFEYNVATKKDEITYPDCSLNQENIGNLPARRSICVARKWIDESVKMHADWLNAEPELNET